MSLGRIDVQVTRYGAPSVVDGVVTASEDTTFVFKASVQPLKEGEKIAFQEDLREAREFYRVYTTTEVFTADSNRQADKVTVFGREFEVDRVRLAKLTFVRVPAVVGMKFELLDDHLRLHAHASATAGCLTAA